MVSAPREDRPSDVSASSYQDFQMIEFCSKRHELSVDRMQSIEMCHYGFRPGGREGGALLLELWTIHLKFSHHKQSVMQFTILDLALCKVREAEQCVRSFNFELH